MGLLIHRQAVCQLTLILATIFLAGAPRVQLTAKREITTVNFTLDLNGAPLVPAAFNTVSPVSLILDTGTDVNILTDRTVARLGLQVKPGVSKTGSPIMIDGQPSRLTTVTTVLVGDFELADVPFFVLPFSRLSPLIGPKTDGILGGPFIKALPMLIDFQKKALTLWSQGGVTDEDLRPLGISDHPPDVALSSWRNDYLYQVPVLLNGKIEEQFIVDTGAGVTLVSPTTAQRLNLVPNRLISKYATFDGEVALNVATLKSINVVTQSVSNLDVGYPNPGSMEVKQRLGLDFLSRFRVLIDVQGKRLILLPPRSTD